MALQAFLAVQHQWRTRPAGERTHWIGLDYAAVEAGLRLAGVETTPELWAEVRMIEQGACAALNEG